MKLEIRLDGAAVIAARRGGAHRREESFEFFQRRLIDALSRVARGKTFEDRPDRIELHELLDRNLTDDSAAKRGADDEPEQVEVAERLSNRCLTDAELLRDAHLDDALARCELAIEDVFDQLIADLVAENAAFPPRRSWWAHLADPFSGSAYATYALTGGGMVGCSEAPSCPTIV